MCPSWLNRMDQWKSWYRWIYQGTIYNAKFTYLLLEWVPFDRFEDIKQIGEGGFAKVYSATWIDGKSYYYKPDGRNWKKEEPKPRKIALKRLNGSQNMSAKYLNEVYYSYMCIFNN